MSNLMLIGLLSLASINTAHAHCTEEEGNTRVCLIDPAPESTPKPENKKVGDFVAELMKSEGHGCSVQITCERRGKSDD